MLIPIFSTRRSGFSMVGLLITIVCMVVLFSILMTSMNKAVTGQGSQQQGTVRSFEDEMYLRALFQSMSVGANENKDSYLVPSELSGSKDISQNTTANLFSAMVMQYEYPPKQLISGNEYSGYVEEKTDYDRTAYNPSAKIFWDPTFQADLLKLSHVSFAHMPLFGERFKKRWKATMDSTFPLLGNRGPKDGISSVDSMACGRNGVWGGHLVFGDGHIAFEHNPAPNNVVFEMQGQRYPDNIFRIDAGPAGNDAILSFTRTMSSKGPELQFD